MSDTYGVNLDELARELEEGYTESVELANEMDKEHLEDGDKLTWYKDVNIVMTWHSDGSVDLFDRERTTISAATFRAINGRWKEKTDHGTGKQPEHWMYNGQYISSLLVQYPNFWSATEQKVKDKKVNKRTRELKITQDNIKIEPIKVELSDWTLETCKYWIKVYKDYTTILGFLVDDIIFDESVRNVDPLMLNNGCYILIADGEPYYVGQGDSVFSRVKDHLSDKHKGKWHKAIILVDRENSFTKDPRDVLEMLLIEQLSKRGAKLFNGTSGNPGNARGVYGEDTKKFDYIMTVFSTIVNKFGYDCLTRGYNSQSNMINNLGNTKSDLKKEGRDTDVKNTPDWLIKEMGSMIDDSQLTPNAKFIDLAIKDGGFIKYLFNRFMKSPAMIARYPMEEVRKKAIKKDCLYGCIQASTSDEDMHDLLMVSEDYITEEHLIVIDYSKEYADKKNGSKVVKDIVTKIKRELGVTKDMNFNVVIGNPPYQKDTGGGKSGGTAIWPMFIDMAKELQPDNIIMITPSRWFTGGQGITNEWRQKWLNDIHISRLVHFSNASEVFPGTGIAGGVSYFNWSKVIDNNGENDLSKNMILFEDRGTNKKSTRQLNQFDVFTPDYEATSIILKAINYIKKYKTSTLDTIISTYGLGTNFRGTNGSIDVITSAGEYKCNPEDVKRLPRGWAVVVSNVMSEHANESSKDGKYRVLTSMRLADNNTVTAGHYMRIEGFNKDEAENCKLTLETKTFRQILRTTAIGIGVSTNCYKYLPLLDFSRSYTDKDLQKMFNLTTDEIEYIENTIKPIN